MPSIYRVGVAIAMTSNASQILGVLGKDLLGIRLKARDVEGSLDRVKLAALGLGGVLGGVAVLRGMAALVDHGKEFVHQQSLMAQAGVSQIDIANATAAAWRNATGILNAGASDNLKLLSDLRNEFGSMNEAIKASPAFTRLGIVTAGITGGDPEQAGYAGSRFLDLRGSLVDPKTGQISEARSEQQARMLEAITVATRGRVGTSELLNFQKQARGAGANLSDQGLIDMVPVIQAMGGYRTGTALMSMMQSLLGGHVTQQAGRFLEQAGVLDPSKVHVRRGGQITYDRGAIAEPDLLIRDPEQYINKVLRAGLIRMGAATPDAQTAALMSAGLRQTVSGLIAEVLRNAVPFGRDAGNIAVAGQVDQYEKLRTTDPTSRLAGFTTAFQNLLTALGAPIVNDATGLIGRLTGALDTFTRWASTHQAIVGYLETFTAALAGLVALGGAIAIAGAASGPFVTGFSALVGIAASTGIVAAGASMLGIAGGLAALGAAIAGLPPLMNYLATHFGPVGTAGVNAANRGHAGPNAVVAPAAPMSTPAGRGNYHPTGNMVVPDGAISNRYSRGNYHPTAYYGGGDVPHAQPIALTVTLDGRQVARSVSTHLTRLMTPGAMPGPTSWDPISTPTPPGLVAA